MKTVFSLRLFLQDTEAPDEEEKVCAARNNQGVGKFVYHDKSKAKYGEFSGDEESCAIN